MADPNVIGSGPYRFVSKSPGVNCVLDANTPGSVVNSIVSPGYYLYCPVYVEVRPDNDMSNIYIPRTQATPVTSNVTIQIRNLWRGGELIVNKYVYLNGTLQGGFPEDVVLPVIDPYPWGTSDNETIHIPLLLKSIMWVKVAVHIKGPPMLDLVHDNPWISQWINVTIPIFVSIRQDITGTSIYDLTGFGSYPTWLKNEAPAPDLKVNAKDVALAAACFGAKPGNVNWNSIADIFQPVDYKINAKDIASIAANFGFK